MTGYVLDTNTVSYSIRGHPTVLRRLTEKPPASISISTITVGELRYGLARRPNATRLRHAIDAFLRRVDILPWDSKAAKHYASLRASLDVAGRGVGALDLLIAAHAVSVDRILVTSDKALSHVSGLVTEDWTMPDKP